MLNFTAIGQVLEGLEMYDLGESTCDVPNFGTNKGIPQSFCGW